MASRTDGAATPREQGPGGAGDGGGRGLARSIPLVVAAVLVGGALVSGLRSGLPAAVLWLAFAALAGAILLFFESLRAALDRRTPGAAEAAAADAAALLPSEFEQRKVAALRALKELAFEHSIRRISDEDYAALRERYRAEAREAMEAQDRDLGAYLARADELIARVGNDPSAVDAVPAAEPGGKKNRRRARAAAAGEGAGAPVVEGEPATETATATATETETETATVASTVDDDDDDDRRVPCAACETRNEVDATFCKRCGAKLEGAA